MATIDVIRNTYGGLEYLNNALGYVSDDRALYRGGYGVNPYDYSMAYNQMLYTRQYFNFKIPCATKKVVFITNSHDKRQ